ncbi:MAG: SafA/ExsA family spore coat assembly protein [Oscillospiraceae bacterium]|nr:SafA/ExsA family spore coat assembly protein [Oscillospiraceae bacterium]
MKKLFTLALSAVMIVPMLFTGVFAADLTHTVVPGDSLWKIANQYQVGLREIKSANPQIKNFDLIYPGDKINIPTVDSGVTAFEQEVIRLVNEIRTQNGLNTLTYDWQLGRVARIKSQDMKDNRYFAHNSPVYGTPFQMIRNFGISFRSAGENIAKGYATPQAVVNGWMNSSGHRANILNARYTHIGVGFVSGGNYWTQMFIAK